MSPENMNYLFYSTKRLDFVHLLVNQITHFVAIDNDFTEIFLTSGLSVIVKRNHLDVRKDLAKGLKF